MTIKWLLILATLMAISEHVKPQIDGEFWWLNDKIAAIKSVKPAAPKYEEISRLETDESDLITFDVAKNMKTPFDNVTFKENGLAISNATEFGKVDVEEDSTTLKAVKPFETKRDYLRDRLSFGVVESSRRDRFLWPDEASSQNPRSGRKEGGCVCIPRELCWKMGGKKDLNRLPANCEHPAKICCVSTPTERRTRILFPDDLRQMHKDTIRFKRSAPGSARSIAPKLIAPSTFAATKLHKTPYFDRPHKIVSVDSDEDPYWNIRNVFSLANFSRTRNTAAAAYGTPDYDDDYALELPRPGLQDFYTDETPRPFEESWAEGNVGDTGYGGGYQSPVLDPRFDHVTISTRLSTKTKPTPSKAPLPEDTEEILDEESDFASSYQSNPDFQIFQDFKLPLYRRSKPRSTTEAEVDSLQAVVISPATSSLDGVEQYEDEEQPYPQCGQDDGIDNGGGGGGGGGSRPWLALATREAPSGARATCAATLVHPRAALVAASCLHGARDGEVTVLAGGGWGEVGGGSEPAQTQRRTAAVHRAVRGGYLALLHWAAPMRACAGVRPACLAAPRAGDACVLAGWGAGGAFRMRPTERRAAVLSASACAAHVAQVTRLTRPPPRGTFCAGAHSAGCAAGGAGGAALVCRRGRRWSAVGVTGAGCARAAPVLLTAVREWTLRALRRLHIL